MLISKKRDAIGPQIIGDNRDKRVFSNLFLHNKAQELLVEIEREPVRQTINLLLELINKRREAYPEGPLNLGLAYALVGEYDESIESLVRATTQQAKESADAHYNLGRVLFESGRNLAQAVSELRVATALDPKNVRAYYYLGQAIRALVERETLVEAEKSLTKYLVAGAPLGYRYEVQSFLDVRRAEQVESSKKQAQR